MAQPCFSASAPGSLMIMGEYAVLHGHPALVAAINQKIYVHVTARHDDTIHIQSSLGKLSIPLNSYTMHKPFEYVLATLQTQTLKNGFDIMIDSEFSSKQGLGSSAAVTVALLAALHQAQQQNTTRMSIYHQALQIIRTVQGAGSGADIAASVFGGMIEYTSTPVCINPIQQLIPISAIFSGEKTSTSDAINIMNKRQQTAKHHQTLIDTLGKLSKTAKMPLINGDLKQLGQLMNQAQAVMTTLGLTTMAIDRIIKKLSTSNVLGAKISGSGLGDCVIALGKMNANNGLNPLPITLSHQGLSSASIIDDH